MRKQIIIRIDEIVKNQLDLYCEKYCVTQNKLLSKVIENFLDKTEKNPMKFIKFC